MRRGCCHPCQGPEVLSKLIVPEDFLHIFQNEEDIFFSHFSVSNIQGRGLLLRLFFPEISPRASSSSPRLGFHTHHLSPSFDLWPALGHCVWKHIEV